jgi:hypothetical protein
MSDIGAMDPGSWHDWHLAWKIGATSFENVTVFVGSAAAAGRASNPPTRRAAIPTGGFDPTITGSFGFTNGKVAADK